VSDEDSEVLGPEERAAFAALATEEAPPPELLRIVTARLRRDGTIRWGHRRTVTRALALAALAATLVAAGFALRARTAGTTAEGRARYVLFLYEGPRYDSAPGENGSARVREYSDWAREIRAHGTLVSGERLGEASATLPARRPGPGGVSSASLAGYFLVDAADMAQAVTIARTCPHLSHGGEVVVREIVR
jgi:hypothetical protein